MAVIVFAATYSEVLLQSTAPLILAVAAVITNVAL
jgi:hypothetical protein